MTDPMGPGVLDAPPARGLTAEMVANIIPAVTAPARYNRNAGRSICIDLLSILRDQHAEVVTAFAAKRHNS